MNFQHLLIDRINRVAVVTLDRPETRNVISDEPLMGNLITACELLGADQTIGAIVLTGRGSAFSAGGNIRQMHDRIGIFGGTTSEIAAWYRSGIQRLIRVIFDLPVPSIAAINGPAIGAGFDLTLACDLRIASTTARFGETFVNLGIVPGDGGSWLLPRAVGEQRAAELAFTGRIINANEALDLGLVLSVHEPEELLPAAISLASTIAEKPPMAMRYTKSLLRAAASTTLDQVLDSAADIQALLHGTTDHHDALARMIAMQRERGSDR